MNNCKSGAVCLFVLILAVIQFIPTGFAVSSDEAIDVLNVAERDLSSAFIMVAEAENAGADASQLLIKLGNAGNFLSEAYASFKSGDYDAASSLALECSNTIALIAGDAAGLKADAKKAYFDRITSTLVMSVAGVCLVLVFGLVGWRFLKRRYFKRVLDMKPKLVGSQ